MLFGFTKVNIMAPYPTHQCGHITQTYDVYDYHDSLFARITGFKDDNQWIIHISADLLSIERKYRDDIEQRVKEYFKDEKIVVITSSTHTHYANDVSNKKYMSYFCDLMVSGIIGLNYKELSNPTCSYTYTHTTSVGKSRISGYESDKEYVCLLTVYDGEKPVWSLIVNNAHPTTLPASIPFFSAEYPGYVLSQLEKKYPDTNFSFVTGAAGDISSRFVRREQSYDALVEMADKLVCEIVDLFESEKKRCPLVLSFNKTELDYKHDYNELDLSRIRGNLSDRELLTIKYGQQLRAEKQNHKENQINSVIVSSLSFGLYKIVFYPNEIFSEYLDCIDINNSVIASYSNGYGPYILPIGFPYLTYEMFLDTLTDETKENIKKVLATI